MKNYVLKHAKPNKTARKIKRIILKSITYLMVIIFILSMLSVDSEKFYIPIISMVISGGWLGLIAWANGWIK